MARPSKPVQLIKIEGKSHRTKAELAHREKAEKSLYTGARIKEQPAVKADPIAHKEFLRLKKLYQQIQYVDGLDEQIVNRYCLLIAQELALIKMQGRMQEDLEQLEEPEDRIAIYKSIASITGKLTSLRGMLLTLEDHLFLTPTSRIKAIPKKPPEEESDSPMASFIKRRSVKDA